jgi:hypothetical protein
MTDAAYGGSYGGGPNPVNQFLADVGNYQTSPNSLQNILGSSLAGIAPGIAGSGLQAALAGEQYNINQNQYGLTTTNLEQQAANQLAGLGISAQQIGLQGRGLQAEAGLLATTTGLEQDQAKLQFGQYPQQREQALLNYGTNVSNLRGNLAASGATNTVGATQQQNLLARNYEWQQADINRAEEQQYLQQLGTTAQQQYSAADIARQQQNLQLVAEQNGLSVQEVQQQLAYGLSQAGLDVRQNLPQLLNSLNQIYSGDVTQIEGAAGQLGLLGGTSIANIGNNAGVNMYSPGVQALR